MTRLRLSTLFSLLVLLGVLLTGMLYCNQGRDLTHAFEAIDSGLSANHKILDDTNRRMLNWIHSEAEAFQNNVTDKYANNAGALMLWSKNYCLFLDSVKNCLVSKSGNRMSPNSKQDLTRGFSSMPAKILTSGEPDSISLARRIDLETQFFCSFIDSICDYDPAVKATIPLQFKYTGNGRFTSGYYQSSFFALPSAGILAILTDLQSRAKIATGVGLNYCFKKVAADWSCGIYFEPFISTRTDYVISGEKYEADIFLGGVTDYFLSGEIKIDGKQMPMKEGIAYYKAIPQSAGRKNIQIEAQVCYIRRTIKGAQIDTFRINRTHSYEVGCEPPKLVLPPSTQFLYAGVDNPISIFPVCGFAPEVLQIDAPGADVRRKTPNQYLVRPSSAGKLTVRITTGQGRPPSVYRYTVYPLPIPQVVLGDSMTSGQIAPEHLGKCTELRLRYPEDFDFPADWTVTSFQITRIRPRADSEEILNKSSVMTAEALRLLRSALPGDRLLFHDILALGPGDQQPQPVGSLVIKVGNSKPFESGQDRQ